MRFVKPIILTVLAMALTAYAFDCDDAATPEQAMQCCDSMPCSPLGHQAEDCCKTMQSMHAPFVQPSSAHSVSYSPFVFAALPVTGEFRGLDLSDGVIAANGHAPPILYAAAPVTLRI
jgi:hypothetical protein